MCYGCKWVFCFGKDRSKTIIKLLKDNKEGPKLRRLFPALANLPRNEAPVHKVSVVSTLHTQFIFVNHAIQTIRTRTHQAANYQLWLRLLAFRCKVRWQDLSKKASMVACDRFTIGMLLFLVVFQFMILQCYYYKRSSLKNLLIQSFTGC